jgi:hypothetical protein
VGEGAVLAGARVAATGSGPEGGEVGGVREGGRGGKRNRGGRKRGREEREGKAENEGTAEGNYVASRLWAANGCGGSPSKTLGSTLMGRPFVDFLYFGGR